MSLYRENYCDFQSFLLFLNKARNPGRSLKNAGNKPKCRISHTIAGRLVDMVYVVCELKGDAIASPEVT